ncbi:MAG: hypothetical protein BAJATHORv1_30044 [Candidatus Thorarchaeota archaeon]|nr:MAG: hypothetical protein BAJATHORv1_30044 [Candidatus Thorarchaeota archaeon]
MRAKKIIPIVIVIVLFVLSAFYTPQIEISEDFDSVSRYMQKDSSLSAESNWLYDWQCRKSVTIKGSMGAGNNYQVRFTIHFGSGSDICWDIYLDSQCNSDFSDIRFTDDDGVTLLNYWMEEMTIGNNAIVWVEIADNLDVDQTIYLYYGNTAAESISNGTATFIAFDDFEADLSKWEVNETEAGDTWELAAAPGGRSGMVGHLQEDPTGTGSQVIGTYFEEHTNIAVHFKFYWEIRAYQFISSIVDRHTWDPAFSVSAFTEIQYDFAYRDTAGVLHDFQDGISALPDTWYDLEYKASSAGKTNLTLDGTTYPGENRREDPISGFSCFRVYGWGKNGLGDEFMLDDFYVRKYIYNEPAVSSSGEVESPWLTSWQYRKAHNISGAVGSGTNYQIAFDLQYGSGTDSGSTVYLDELCKSDFADIRFTDDDGITLLDYWIEESTSGDYATVWVEMNDTLDVDQSIYLYYGNPTAESISDGEATFLFFDDFNADLDLNKWNMTSGDISTSNGYLELISTDGTRGSIDGKVNISYNTAYTVRGYANGLSTQNTHLVELRTGYPENVSKIDSYGSNSANYFYFETGVSGSFDGEYAYFPSSITDQHSYTLFRKNDTATWYQDNSQVHSTSTLVPDIDLQPCLTEGSISGEIWYIDHLYIRNWNPNGEPLHNEWGELESTNFDMNPPVLVSFENDTIEAGTIGNVISWTFLEDNPSNYELFINDNLETSGSWDGSELVFSVDGLQLGSYEYQIVVYDSFSRFTSHSIEVHVLDTTGPEVTSISSMSIELGSSGNELTWQASDLYPDSYSIYINGTISELISWSGNDITLPMDDLSLGVYNYTLIFRDTSGNTGNSSTIVTIVDTINPEISQPSDIEFIVGTLGESITWTVTEANPASYVVYLDDTVLVSSEFGEPDNQDQIGIAISLNGLDIGVYNYTIVVVDEGGNAISDTVMVYVIADTTSTTTNDTTTTTTNPGNPFDTISIIITIGSFVVIIIVIAQICRARGNTGSSGYYYG